MRFLMKIPMPTAAENPVVGEPDFEEKLRNLFTEIGGQATYATMQDGRRIEWVVVDIQNPALITPAAEFIFRFLKVKIEFLPEMAPKPYYGRVGY
jgi:hypothetical protein